MKIENIIKKYDKLKQNRTHFVDAWHNAQRFASPHSPQITGASTSNYNRRTSGSKDRDNYDSTAELAARNLASVVLTSSTPPDQKWINFKSANEEAVKDNQDALDYIDSVETLVIGAINDSNFYIKKYEFDKSRVVFGTGVMFVEEGMGNKDLNFRSIHIGDVALAENSEGYVDTVYREVYTPVRELVQKFGLENLSDAAKVKYEKNPFEEVKILHCVYPRTDDERERDSKGGFRIDSKNLPWTDMWIEYDQKHKIREGGFRRFPYVVSRWEKEAGQVYGHGPIMDAMADIKMLNRMERSRIQLAEKINNPPKAVIGAEMGDLDLTPGYVNYFDEDVKIEDLVTGGNFPVTDATVKDKKDMINAALYVDQFQSLDKRMGKEMTAAEVQALQMETLRILAPVLGRNQPEILRPLMLRIIDILEVNGKLIPQPDGMSIELDYVNELSRAMKMGEVNAVRSVVMNTAELANVFPEVIDNIDPDQVYKLLSDATGIPANISNSKEKIAEIREARAKQQEQAQQIQLAMAQVQMSETAAQTEERQARAEKSRKETYSE